MDGLIHASEEISGLEFDEENQEFIGKGYSGIVYKVPVNGTNRIVVKKIFHSEGLPKLINSVVFGNPLDRVANESAARADYFRRRVFNKLIPFWTNGTVQVANSLGYGFDPDEKAFYLLTEYIEGHPAQKATPFSGEKSTDLDELVNEVMKPMSEEFKTMNSSDWQFNYKSSRSVKNFIKGRRLEGEVEDESWFCIDFESGVPALAVMPIPKLGYLKDFLRYLRRFPLFDDVDTDLLEKRVEVEHIELAQAIGEQGVSELESDITELRKAQREWKSIPRSEKYITYLETKGKISPEKAQKFRDSKAQLYSHVGYQTAKSSVKFVGKTARNLAKWTGNTIWESAKITAWPGYGTRFGRDYISSRLDDWVEKDLIQDEQAQIIRTLITEQKFRTRFGGLAGQIPVYFASQSLNLAVGTGVAAHLTANEMYWALLPWGIYMAALGTSPFVRATYIAGYSLITRNFPKTALKWSLVTGLGNFAFIFQMARDAREAGVRQVSDFFLYDTVRKIASSKPMGVWGGDGTYIDLALNRWAYGRLHRDPTKPSLVQRVQQAVHFKK